MIAAHTTPHVGLVVGLVVAGLALAGCTRPDPPTSASASPPAIIDAEVHATSASTATAADPPAPDSSEASTPISAELETHLDLGALVGGRRSITTPTPGRYASLLRASQRRFITMEHTVAESIDGGASIELHPDGRVEACFWATARSGGSISRFASRDGEDHHNQSEHRQRLGARGSWRAEPDASSVIVRLDALQWRTCQAGAEAWQPPAPIELPCHALAAGDGLPVAAILCRPPANDSKFTDLALVLEDHPRSGSWKLREDLSGRAPRAFGLEVQPWLLLGAAPGLRIDADDPREGEAIEVTIVAGEAPTPTGELAPG